MAGALVIAASCSPRSLPEHLDMATTTAIESSGILESVLPAFEAAPVRVHATGSGRALAMLDDGVVDVAMTHAPEAEARFLAAHSDWRYRKFAYNRFIVVGPPEDPARVAEAADALDAFRRIAASPMTFITRGDESGVHEREQRIWRAADVTPDPSRLIVSDAGMAAALINAHERQGYTLSDEATFRQLRAQLNLVPLLTDDPRLLNMYAVTYPAGNPTAAAFADWLVRGGGRTRFGAFEIEGTPAFTVWPDNCPADTPEARPCG